MRKTDEQIEEIERLKQKFKPEGGNKINRKKFAEENKFPGGDAMINQHLQGLRPIGIDAAIAYAKGFNCSLDEISPRLARDIRKYAAFLNASKVAEKESNSTDKESVCEAYRLANYETKEVVGLVLLGTNDPLPKWANEEMRKSINAMKYSVIEWRRNEKKSC